MANKKLNPKQIAFAQAYAKHGNATQAYLDAGYKVTEKVAGTNGPRMLENAGICEAIQRLQKPALKKAEVTVERITAELAKIAFSGMGDIVEVKGDRITIKEDADLSTLDSINFSESHSTEGSSKAFSFKKSDKLKALDMLLKMTGGYERSPESDSGNLRNNAGRILEALRGIRGKK